MGFFELVVRLNTSSISRIGPMYSIFILKLAFRISGICSWVLWPEWKRRFMQSSTSATRPVATTILKDILVQQRPAAAGYDLL
jgi:hypothetical protein